MAVSTRHASCPSIVVIIELIFAFSSVARAADVDPLRPVDTSSPRATLQGFVVSMDEVYRGMKEIVLEYAESKTIPKLSRTTETGRDTFYRRKGDKSSGSVRHSPCTPRYCRA